MQNVPTMKGRRPAKERFMSKFRVNPEIGCHEWTACKGKDGYGRFNTGGKHGPVVRAHKFSYETFKGPIPDGLQIDHLCRNRICCNPDHLEAVTQQENIRRGDGGKHMREKTHCPKGHPYSGANLYIEPSTGRRRCQVCTKATRKKYRMSIQGLMRSTARKLGKI